MQPDSSSILTVISSIFSFLSAAVLDNVEKITVFVLTIIGIVFNILYTLWKWYRKVKKDGKISEEEIDELFSDIDEQIKRKE